MSTINYCLPLNSKTFYNSLDEILAEYEFKRKNKKVRYANVPSVFDIEASSFYKDDEKQCCMYAWVFGINGRCVRGRTWNEFIDVIEKLTKRYELSIEKRLIIYVHNLSYEFQWFKKYFEWEKVFCLDTRKPVYALTKSGIEFRCSYLLSGYSLAKLGDNLTKYKIKKAVGDLDYSLIRHSRTHLTQTEWGYILNDGLVVMAHIQEEIERLGDITKLPLTKTGYVRNLCREKCLKGDDRFNFVKSIKRLTLTPETYAQMKHAFMGGFTHANYHYVGKIMYNVDSFDFTSSYPAVMVSEQFPMSKPIPVSILSEEDFVKNLKCYCCMFDIEFINIRSKVNYDNYISKSRCNKIENPIINNGRVVEADSLSITLTEQDFFIIYDMYEWDSFVVSNFYKFYKDYLPKDFILTILELYKNKTELKGVVGKEVEYLVSKGMINSCYGMCVTDICRDEITYEDDYWSTQPQDVQGVIDKYNKDTQRFLYYAWGIWVTAYARRNLFSGIKEFDSDYIYSDTDSLKVINVDKHKKYIEEYNKNIASKIRKCLKHHNIPFSLSKPKTIDGEEKPLGVWDYEGRYSRFKTLGAKRYLTEKNGVLELTVAGVNKKTGIEYLLYNYKDNTSVFNAFEEGLYFPPHYDKNGEDKNASGKMCHTYIDLYMEGEIVDYMGYKGIYNEQSGVHMENTDYTLSLEEEFIRLLKGKVGSHICL